MMPAVLLIEREDLPVGVSIDPISSVISFQKSTWLSAVRCTVELPTLKAEPPPPLLPPLPPLAPPPLAPPPAPGAPLPVPPAAPEPSVAVLLPTPFRERRR